ncbi:MULTISPECIES: DUF2214 family protein [unclassified Picosynechococcus]|uniref:DUF2214 family protein n=1 Tax=unclassified Picosynechococcus TaxID=3079910 RepID=UPI0007458E76|nr:hypothetical protein AWQ23_12040 [Picosynechococcus sp. PCC 73109]ANV88151.1 hypothetical protein AWQ22_12150 [Picosynechococcus sp. PCC 7117]
MQKRNILIVGIADDVYGIAASTIIMKILRVLYFAKEPECYLLHTLFVQKSAIFIVVGLL